jgi:hypothetical protein
MSPHLQALGAKEIDRSEFLRKLSVGKVCASCGYSISVSLLGALCVPLRLRMSFASFTLLPEDTEGRNLQQRAFRSASDIFSQVSAANPTSSALPRVSHFGRGSAPSRSSSGLDAT